MELEMHLGQSDSVASTDISDDRGGGGGVGVGGGSSGIGTGGAERFESGSERSTVLPSSLSAIINRESII